MITIHIYAVIDIAFNIHLIVDIDESDMNGNWSICWCSNDVSTIGVGFVRLKYTNWLKLQHSIDKNLDNMFLQGYIIPKSFGRFNQERGVLQAMLEHQEISN